MCGHAAPAELRILLPAGRTRDAVKLKKSKGWIQTCLLSDPCSMQVNEARMRSGAIGQTALELIDGLQLLTWLETHCFAGRDGHLGARSRVATNPRLTRPHVKHAK